MKNKVLDTALAVVLIIAITIADFIWVGMNLVTYALENFDNSTSNNNVKFVVYLKNGEGKEVTKADYEINSNEMKLYMEVAVENEGYFDGVITLENSNFKLKPEKLSREISKIEGNTITLNRVRAGNKARIEVGIEPIVAENYSVDMLSKESVLKLTGNYKDSTEKNISIESEKTVTLSLIAPNTIDTTLEGKVITNRIYKIGETNKRIIQLELNMAVVENAYPVKSATYEVALPEGVEELKVITKGTYATNGEADKKLEESSYEFNETSRTLKVTIENPSKDGKISWKKDSTDNIIVTMILPENVTLGTEEYIAKAKVEFYGQEAKTIEKEVKYNLTKESDGIIRTSIENKEEIYKGKIYSKEEREYKSTTKIEINYANLIENASIQEKVTYRVEKEAEDKQTNIQYKTTTISKAEIEKILGTEGKLTIKDQNGNIVKEITAETEVDENGNYVVTYAEGVKELTVEITKAIETGIIRLNHTKVIKAESYTREEITALKYLIEQASVKYSTAEYSYERRKQLGETTSEVALTVVPQTISTETDNKNMQIAITLKTDNEKYELFKAPTFTLTMPEGVTINSLTNGTISATNEELSISKLEANGRNVVIEVSGEQQKYITSNINSQITFTANVKIEKLMPNKIDVIKMQYTNQGKTSELESAPINIIASNSKMVTHLKLENYNGLGATVEKYSDSQEKIKKDIPVENTEEIQVPVKYTIINNYNQPITVTAKLGAILTNKEGNEQDISNQEDRQITIEAGTMQVIDYTLNIPAGLYYSEKVKVEATVDYIYSSTNYHIPNNIILATEEKEGIRDISIIGDKIQIETFAQLGDKTGIRKDDEIYNEQIIGYILEVTNISNETISNIRIENKQDNGNIYDLKEVKVVNYVISPEPYIEHRYAELNTNEKVFDNFDLQPGETKELLCRVVTKKTQESNITSANISIEADGMDKHNLPKISNKVKDANLKVSIEKSLNEEVQMYGDENLTTLVHVKNLTNEQIKDLNMKLYLSEELSWNEKYIIKVLDSSNNNLDIIKNINYNEEENCLNFNIKTLEENQVIKLIINIHIDKIPLEKVSSEISAYAKINDIIANSININIKQVETELSVTQRVNIEEGQKVERGDTVIITGEITNIGSVKSIVSIADNLPNGLEVQKIELIKNGQVIDKTGISVGSYVNVVTEIDKGETVILKIETTVDPSLVIEEEIKNIISAFPMAGKEVTSEEITIKIQSDVDDNMGIELPDIKEPDDEKSEVEIPDGDDEELDNIPPEYEIPDETDPDLDDPGNDDPGNDDPGNDDPGNDDPGNDDPGNDDPGNDDPGNDDPGNDDPVEEMIYSITGYAWIDKNENGSKENNEAIKNVKVKLIDLNNNNSFLKDKDGKEIEVETNKEGLYEIKEIPKGKYNILFKYDTSTYEIEESEEIKNYIIEETKEKFAITSTIDLNENKTVNLELVELTEFDLQIDKYISKVIVQTVNGNKTSGYENKQLVREEIQSKYLSGATVLVEYTIKVSNVGELAGYATEIIDYLPKDMKFYSELNTQWYAKEDGNIYNTTLASELIKPGEIKTLKLILSKTMTKNNTGITPNIVEITEMMNIKDYSDINVNNNQSKAELIVNPATGTIITYLISILSSITIIVVGMYIIKKNVIRKEN